MSKSSDLQDLLAHGSMPEERILFHPILMQLAARLNNSTYTEFMTDYRVLVESNVKCLEKFDMDAVGLISDPYRETSAFGARVEFYGNKSPYCQPVVNTYEDLGHLTNPNILMSDRTSDRIRAAEYYVRLLGNSVPIIGWIEGPLAEAADLAGVNNILLKILVEEDFVRKLMDICLVTAKDFARCQIEAGCLVIGIGDAVCSQVDPGVYENLIFPLHRELVEYIHSLDAFVKMHICGDITHLLELLGQTGIDILDLDWMVDFDLARQAVGDKTVLCGNLDPVSCIQDLSADKLAAAGSNLISSQKDRPFIFSGGCEITPDTPPENMMVLRKISKLAV